MLSGNEQVNRLSRDPNFKPNGNYSCAFSGTQIRKKNLKIRPVN